MFTSVLAVTDDDGVSDDDDDGGSGDDHRNGALSLLVLKTLADVGSPAGDGLALLVLLLLPPPERSVPTPLWPLPREGLHCFCLDELAAAIAS